MRERLKRIWKEWGQPFLVTIVVCWLMWFAGFMFTKGSQAAGGLVVITVTYQE